MHTFVLQDWITVRGASGINITQSESEWLDLTQYEDLTLWIDCKEITGTTVTINIETSPTKDDTLFSAMYAATLTTTLVSPSTAAAKILMSSATVPVARYVRWKLVAPAAAYDATFRVFISANAPGA